MNTKPRAAPPLRIVPRPHDALGSGPNAARQPLDGADPATDLDSLYRRYAPYVAAIATRLLGRDDDLDDVVQDVFMDALRGLSQLRDAQAVRGWLSKVTVRTSVRRLRRRRLLRTLHLQGDLPYEGLAAPGATADQKALLAKIYGLLDRLPTQTRVIWILRHVLGESLHGIVELSECSQSTVQRKLRDAESLLSRELYDE